MSLLRICNFSSLLGNQEKDVDDKHDYICEFVYPVSVLSYRFYVYYYEMLTFQNTVPAFKMHIANACI